MDWTESSIITLLKESLKALQPKFDTFLALTEALGVQIWDFPTHPGGQLDQVDSKIKNMG